jgi:hypothetical protein
LGERGATTGTDAHLIAALPELDGHHRAGHRARRPREAPRAPDSNQGGASLGEDEDSSEIDELMLSLDGRRIRRAPTHAGLGVRVVRTLARRSRPLVSSPSAHDGGVR